MLENQMPVSVAMKQYVSFESMLRIEAGVVPPYTVLKVQVFRVGIEEDDAVGV
jgi:hypothetical protein